jgi:Glycosyl transferase family 11
MSLIVTRLTGGLGNQMFQFAAGYALSLRRGVRLELDTSSYARDALRVFELSAFATPGRVAGPTTLRRMPAKQRGLTGLVRRMTQPTVQSMIPIYREPHFEFDASVLTLDAPHALSGYWQSERYFDDARDAVRAAFRTHEPFEPENAAVASDIAQCAMPVSLHVRRGDYVTASAASAVHGTCSIEYYRMAMQTILDQTPQAHFFAFSDDPAWTRDNLGETAPITFVSANPPTRGYRDMQLMSSCRHHIIANSSFSWWGAWLNPRDDKRVIAPSVWFAAAKNDTRDLLPAGWERI